ncbi:MAG TPA: ATP-binding protein [Steroidobacteraceae bacterium]|nr:ATP-binding protein [Steroidobacteraceae bacterium]
MRKLHLKLYLAIVGTLVAFLILIAMVWHHLAPPRMALGGIESAAGLAAVMFDERRHDPESTREVLVALSYQSNSDVALYDAQGKMIVSAGRHVPKLTPDRIADSHWMMTRNGPVFNRRLADGSHLIVHPRHRIVAFGLHMGLVLTTIAALLALLTYPLTRGITARLARLQTGVRQFGAGNLAARVKVEGRDEVAALANSFNESAEHIEKLVRAHQMLLANCSHELRTPLARIRMGIERVPGTSPEANAELARNIAELDALIGEMLLSSRLDVSSGIERAEPVDLLALAAEEAAHFDLQASGEALIVKADALLLRRLVRNLLENARVHAGGATEIRIEGDPQFARIVIEDAGQGVAYQDRDRIFEPFYRASTATRSSGAGLGLAIVRQIAHAHGGAVAHSPREGGGSRFTVTLPR